MGGDLLPFPKMPCKGSCDAPVWVALDSTAPGPLAAAHTAREP